MTSRNIKTDALDFDEIKENLKEYLRGQSEFTDYDFDGSAMSILLDVLAYNTHYNSLYTNLAANEMFLDSARKYSSVTSLAKSLGYTARSVTSARAKVNVIIVASDTTYNTTDYMVLPKGTKFTTSIGDREFSFLTTTDTASQGVNVDGVNNTFYFYDVELVEGSQYTKMYTVSDTAEFVVPNLSADMSTVTVRVQASAGSGVYTSYGAAQNVLTVQSDSTVYFTKQREDLYYQIYFGNNTVGKALSNGNVVHITYMTSNGAAANKANRFTYSSGIEELTYTSITTETVSIASGGSDAEDIESIRFNAPRAFAAQNRAVTADDYKNILYTNYPSVETVTCWGGQDNDPPVYGKVFIAAKPSGGDIFTDAQKLDMINFLKRSKGVISITPVFVDPVFLRVEITSNVYYNPSTARRTTGEMEGSIRDSIATYTTSLGQFGSTFRHSRISSLIDNSDDAIISNITRIRVRRSINPIYNISSRYNISFGNPIYQNPAGGSFLSTRIYVGNIANRCYLKDDGKGSIYLYSEDVSGKVFNQGKYGTINYQKGTVAIPSMLIRGVHDPLFEFVFQPMSNDVVPLREYIIESPESLLSITMLPDSIESTGVSSSSHIFTSSR